MLDNVNENMDFCTCCHSSEEVISSFSDDDNVLIMCCGKIQALHKCVLSSVRENGDILSYEIISIYEFLPFSVWMMRCVW